MCFSEKNKNNQEKEIRKPVVAGQFYEKDFKNLNKQIEACFNSNKGSGVISKTRFKNLIAVISPHAGYFFSGACASWAYKEIAESEFPDAYIILGPNHYGFDSGISKKEWETPLGIIETNKEIIELLEKKTSLKINENCHIFEHSIEVQLPFLQYVSCDKIKELKIVPIVIGHELDFKEIGKELFNIYSELEKKKKKIAFIISSDFTHYGKNYDYLPFVSDVKNKINQLDQGAINLIKNLDVNGFYNYLKKTKITICGFSPILVFLTFLNELTKIKKINSELLMYYTSGDILGYKNSVSYVSMVFR
ncbi:MAG: AmmeMemoRadiSam system protein B [Candidatus Woesearchaeota archaeon]